MGISAKEYRSLRRCRVPHWVLKFLSVLTIVYCKPRVRDVQCIDWFAGTAKFKTTMMAHGYDALSYEIDHSDA